MWFSRQAKGNAHSVAIAATGDALHAVGVILDGERPRLAWHVRHEGASLADGLRLLSRDKRVNAGTKVVGLLHRTAYRLVSTEAPDLPREEWRDAVRWRLKDTVDFPVDEAVVDVLEVPQDSSARTARASIAFLAPSQAPRDMALVADDAGLSWSAIEVPETALRNLSTLAETPGKAHALMVFGQDHALLVITFNGELLMTRTIEVAASALIDSEESRGGALGRAGLEVLRTLDTYERTNSNAALSGLSVVLPSGTEGMLEVLADLVYVPVKAYELGDKLDMGSAVDANGQPLTTLTSLEELSVLGAALRPLASASGRQQIDLRDPEMQQGAATWGAVWGARALAVMVALLAVMVLGMSAWSRQMAGATTAIQAEVAGVRQSMGALPKVQGADQLRSLQDTDEQQRRLRDALASAAGTRTHGYADYFMALGRQAQPGLWITGMKIDNEGRDLELSGRMTDPGFLPLYLGRLQGEERFKGRRFAQLEMSVVDQDAGTSGLGITQFVMRTNDASRGGVGVKEQR